jgi:hypothetical protein
MESVIAVSATTFLVALFSFCIFVMPLIHDVLEQRRFRREVDAQDRPLDDPPRWSAEATRRRVRAMAARQRSTRIN